MSDPFSATQELGLEMLSLSATYFSWKTRGLGKE